MVFAVFSKVYCSTGCSCSIIYVCQLFPCRTRPILSAMNASPLFPLSTGHHYITLLMTRISPLDSHPKVPFRLTHTVLICYTLCKRKTQAPSFENVLCDCWQPPVYLLQ